MSRKTVNIKFARQIIVSLGLPKAQHNDRSALCLLALLDVTPEKTLSSEILLKGAGCLFFEATTTNARSVI